MNAKAHKGKGQVSMDFIIAITILAFGLVVLICQVPMLFAPFQTVSTDIQPVAYRTGMILAEDGGIYEKSEGNISSRWEDPEENEWNYTENWQNLSNYHGKVKRIGLAMSIPGWSSSEDIVPNKLSVDKIKALQEWWNDGNSYNDGNSSWITNKLGLFVTYNDISLNYSYNISIMNFSNRPVLYNNDPLNPLLQIGNQIPLSGATVDKIERIVVLSDTTDITGYVTIAEQDCAKLVICIWR